MIQQVFCSLAPCPLQWMPTQSQSPRGGGTEKVTEHCFRGDRAPSRGTPVGLCAKRALCAHLDITGLHARENWICLRSLTQLEPWRRWEETSQNVRTVDTIPWAITALCQLVCPFQKHKVSVWEIPVSSGLYIELFPICMSGSQAPY